MTVAPIAQILAFAGACCVGVVLGLVYDVFRPFRRHAPLWGEYLFDLLFWFLVTVAIFISAPVFGDGRIRGFMILAHILGAAVYFKLLSPLFRWFTTLIERSLSRFMWFILWPFRRIASILAAPLSLFFTQMKKSVKKFFSFPSRWFRIKKMPKESTSAASASGEGEEHHVSNQKGWSSD